MRFPAAAALGLWLLLWLAGPAAADLAGPVLRVHDGDTLEVAGVGTVRLLGIDSPEREASERDRFLLRRGVSAPVLRRTAAAARTFVAAAAGGRTVRLDPGEPARDRHGRLLADVFLPDGRLLNRLLLEKGLAVVYRRFDFPRKADFLAAEAAARKRRAGLWGD